LTVASLLRQYAAGYVERYRPQAVPQVQSTLAKLSLCRTAALGGRRYQCTGCASECLVYNSCGDRHCPQCAGAKRSDWLESTAALLLPGREYFQVVFTIPETLSSLTLGNRRVMYDLLFQSAWQSLRAVIGEEQGFEASAAMVLHTWNQKLEPHVHVHAVVPGGGPSLRGERRWVTSHRRDVPHAVAPYLVDADVLRQRFRQTFLAGLRRLHERGALKLGGPWSALQSPAAFEAWLAPLEQVNWVTYIQPPPQRRGGTVSEVEQQAHLHVTGPILGGTGGGFELPVGAIASVLNRKGGSPFQEVSPHISQGGLIGAWFSRSRGCARPLPRLAVVANVVGGASGTGGGLGLGGGWIRTRVVAS